MANRQDSPAAGLGRHSLRNSQIPVHVQSQDQAQLAMQYKEAKEQLQMLREERDGYKSDCAQLPEQLQRLREERDGYKSAYAQLSQQLQELQRLREECDGYKSRCAQLSQQLEELQRFANPPCTECREKNRRIQELEQEQLLNQRYIASFQSAQQLLAETQHELDEKDRELKQLKSEVLRCPRNDCQQVQQELWTLKQGSTNLHCSKTGCANTRHRAEALEKEKDRLQREKTNLADRAAQASSAAKETQQKKKCEIDRLQTQAKELRRELGSANEKLQKASKESDEMGRKLQQKKEKIKEMESKVCNSRDCLSEHAKKTLSVVGSGTKDGLTVSQALEQMDGKLDRLWQKVSQQPGQTYASAIQGVPAGGHGEMQRRVESLQHQNEANVRKRESLERKVEELTSQLHGPKCQRPECVKLRRELRLKEVAELNQRKGEGIGRDMEKITGGDYGKLIERFEALTTSPDGLLGQLEEVWTDTSKAKRTLSRIFTIAYHHSKEAVIESIKETLEALFVIDKDAPREKMEDASRGYGRLLHASGSKTNHAQVEAVTSKIRGELEASKHGSTFQLIFQRDPFILNGLVELAWQFVTLPNPMVVWEPHKFSEQTHEREFGYWDPSASPDTPLIYIRPAVYRSYQGDLALKAWVANSQTPVEVPDPSEQSPSASEGGSGLFSTLRGLVNF